MNNPGSHQKNEVYVASREGIVAIGNRFLELQFDTTSGALVGILDQASAYQFSHDDQAPRRLFRLALRLQAGRELEWLDSSSASHCTWESTALPSGSQLSLTVDGFAGRALSVVVEIRLAHDSPLSVWHATVRNPGAASVYQLTCPIVSGLFKVGAGVPDDTIVTPRHGEGMLFREPFPVCDRLPLKAGAGPDTPQAGIGELHATYPGGLAMQMMLYYNQQAGLYLATHDSGQHVKSFDLGQIADWGPYPLLSVSHLCGEAMGAPVSFSYDTILGVFHGDWYDGAAIYKAWATQQWWCEKKLAERDIASWMRSGFAVFEMSNYHLPNVRLLHSMDQIAEVVNSLSSEAGVPLLALVFNFEGKGGWTGPIGFFPPREGEEPFRRAMEKLQAVGNRGFLYIPGGNWYIAIGYEPPFDSWPEFEATGRANAIMAADLAVRILKWYPGWEGARLCPGTEFTDDLTASLVLGCIERGAPVVQIDNFPICTAEACYDPSHNHLPGYGPWWSEAWNRILADTRRRSKALNPESALSSEGISENFIPYLDMYDQRAGNMEYFGHWQAGDPLGGETIPLFNFVYNEYIGSYCAAYPECNRPEVLYWTRCLGKSLVQGVVPTGGWYYPEPDELNPVTTGFFKKVARAAGRECWPYLMFGDMLRPPTIDVPRIRAPYLPWTYGESLDPARLHFVEDAAVQHSAWRGPDGTIGYVFVNVSEEAVDFSVELEGYGLSDLADLIQVADGERTILARQVHLPAVQRIHMQPLSTVLIEICSAAAPG